jgi:hypothetical protein
MIMMTLRKPLAAAALLLTSATLAQAVNCPDPIGSSTRQFSLNVTSGATATCYAFGDGNPGAGTFPGFPLIDKSDDSTTGSAGGTNHILDPIQPLHGGLGGAFALDLSGYSSVLLVFKTGNNETPDWAAFLLSGINGIVNAVWSNEPRQGGGLSHASLYGTPSPVPVPPAALLLCTGVAGLVAARRKRKATK